RSTVRPGHSAPRALPCFPTRRSSDLAASARGRPYDEFALYQEYLFEKDMTALRVNRPAYEPRARHHVRQVQQLAAALLATGHAYQREGHVYFRGGDLPARAGLSLAQARELSAEYGDDPGDPLRDDPFDVPVWRPSGPEQPAWPSPWGPGRPGWHADCAAMATAVLGPAVDLLAGGADLRYPHHAYQAAMAEAARSVAPFARAHLHVGTVHQDGATTAKSTGNRTPVSDRPREYPPAAVRLLIVRRRGAESWTYRPADLATAAPDLERRYTAAGRPDATPAATAAVTAALLDDLDVPRAVAVATEAGGEAARLLLRVLSLA